MIDQQLRTGLSAPESIQLREHAAGCPDCQARLSLQRSVQGALQWEPPPLSPATRARWQASLESPAAPLSRGWPFADWRPVLLAAALAALAGSFGLWALGRGPEPKPSPILIAGRAEAEDGPGRTEPGAQLPTETWLRLQAGSVVQVGGAELRVESVLGLWLPEHPGPAPLKIAYGTGTLALLASPPSWTIDTPAGRLAFESGRFRLRVQAQESEVEVESGEARLEPADGSTRVLRPGQRGRLASEPPAEPSPGASPTPKLLVPDPAPSDPQASLPTTPAAKKAGGRPQRAQDQAEVAEARGWVGRDDEKAAQLAETVLARRPEATTEAEALMVAADAWRHRGERARAAGYYQRASEHAGGGGFAEEALLRRATLLFELNQTEEALAALGEAERRFDAGSLFPERAALSARLLLADGRVDQAAAALERVATAPDRILDQPRLAVARALLEGSPARAARLLAPLLHSTGPQREEAQALLGRAAAAPNRKQE